MKLWMSPSSHIPVAQEILGELGAGLVAFTTQEIMKVFGTLSGTDKKPNIIIKDISCTPVAQEITRILGTLFPGVYSQRPNVCVLFYQNITLSKDSIYQP